MANPLTNGETNLAVIACVLEQTLRDQGPAPGMEEDAYELKGFEATIVSARNHSMSRTEYETKYST